MHLRTWSILYLLALATLPAVSVVLLRGDGRTASGLLPHEAYVWQRLWTPAVTDAVRDASPHLQRLVALAAEISWDTGKPLVAEADIDLSAMRPPFGLALSIGPTRPDAAKSTFVADHAHAIVSRAPRVSELQIDFDCPESQLDGYRQWVRAIKQRISPVPLVITALPSWLDRPAFAALARECDGYVLQVHSLHRPGMQSALCDPAEAQRAVRTAGRLGIAFRVALPSYGYMAAFDRDGRMLAMWAEGPPPQLPADAKVRAIHADPADMASLVRNWAGRRPAAMKGIIWYRLPVADDTLNWRWCTLAAVMQGQAPAADLQATVKRSGDGLLEITLINAGNADAPLDVEAVLDWRDARRIAADSLGGFAHRATGASQMTFVPADGSAGQRLPPGQSRPIGWLRLDKDTEVHAYVRPNR